MIPKIIHYCWFGRNPLPKMATKCIKSWKKYCPGYEIKRWDEDSFDISSAPLYVRQAYEAKKWAFVTDYVRLWAMTQFGGIYMDTDVEVVKPLDQFLAHDAFSGFETGSYVPTGIMACCKDYPLFLELLHEYDALPFIREDGSFDMTTNVIRITNSCLQYGLQLNNQFQIVDGFALYPNDFFCPIDCATKELHKTENTCTIHWFSASWWSQAQKKNHKHTIRMRKIKAFLRKVLGTRLYLFGKKILFKIIKRG